jgi:hypothetical protein
MKKIYGMSMVEGAPLGNKNASGPHKKSKSIIRSIDVRYGDKSGATLTTTIGRGGGGKSSSKKIIKSRGYGNITKSSNARLHRAIGSAIGYGRLTPKRKSQAFGTTTVNYS